MPISNRLIRVHMPADGVASAYAETDLIVPHDVRKMTVKGIVYKSTKNVSNQDAEFLTVFSNLVDGPLGFVYDDVTKGTAITTELVFKFESPRRFAGKYHFEARKSNGDAYPMHAGLDYLLIIVEFDSDY